MSQSRSNEVQSALPPPSFPQADAGVLNLEALNGDAVRVCAQAYPERNVGDRITVRWCMSGSGSERLRRYLYLPAPGRDEPDVQYETRIEPLWALLAGDYEVDYTVTSRTGNVSQSAPAQITVTGTPAAPTSGSGGPVQTSLFGVYPPGLVGTWIVPAAYTVASLGDVLAQSLAHFSAAGTSTPHVTLQLYKNGDGHAFARIVSDAAGKTWTTSVAQATRFARGDLISVQLEGTHDSSVYLALAV